ncbi:hypothetical protein LTR41_012262, partial [Exophiala xenobiotica]
DEVGTSQVVLAQILDALLTDFDVVNNHVFQRRTSRRYGDVKFLIDSPEISKPSMETINTPRVLESQ